MKDIFFGENQKAPDPSRCAKLGLRAIEAGIINQLVVMVNVIGFEASKSVKDIFTNLVNHDYGQFQSQFLMDPENSNVFEFLLGAYQRKAESALICGEMLRVCLSKKAIAKKLLTMDNLKLFFKEYLHRKDFTVWADALSTFRVFVESDHIVDFLAVDAHFVEFFKLFHEELVLRIDEYVTVRESLKLLGEMLLKRSNYNIMMRYIGDKGNLKVIMTVMTSKAENIKTEAFHVFKVFVANPKKTPPVHALLYHNRALLIEYLERFRPTSDEEQTDEEQKLLITTLKRLDPPEAVKDKDKATADAAPDLPAPTTTTTTTTEGTDETNDKAKNTTA